MRLNDALTETNQGVLALHATLEESAEQVRWHSARCSPSWKKRSARRHRRFPAVDLPICYLPAHQLADRRDLYDWLVLPDGWLHVCVVDVVGHGVAST